MGDPEIVQDLSQEDAERLAALLPQVVSTVDGDPKTNLKNVVEGDSSDILVIRADTGEIAASLVINLLQKAAGQEGRLNDVVVDEAFRGQGLGRLLCEAALEEMRAAGAYKAEWSSRPQRIAANALYQSMVGPPRPTNVYTTYLKQSGA